MRVDDDRGGAEREEEPRELVQQQLRRLEVHVRVDQAGHDVAAAGVEHLPALVLAEAGHVAVDDRDVDLEPLACEDREDAPPAHDEVGGLVPARDRDPTAEILHRHSRSSHAAGYAPRRGRAHAEIAGRGARPEGGAAGRAPHPGRHRRHGRPQLRPRPPGGPPEPERGRRAARLVARGGDPEARRRDHVRGGHAGRARAGPAGARGGGPDRRRAADPQPGHDRRQPRHGVARGGRAAAAARRRRGGARRERAHGAAAPARGVPRRAETEPARPRRADRGRARPPGGARDVHEGRPAQRDGDLRGLARAPGRRRAARELRLRRAGSRPRPGGPRRGGRASRPGRRGGDPDRRRARHGRLPAARAARPHPPRARPVPDVTTPE